MTAPGRLRGRPDWFTVPNAITVLRLVLLAPVCWALLTAAENRTPNLLAPVLLAVWSGTDWVDGWLARRLGQTSRAGEILDPVADRVGIAAVAATLAVTGLLWWWLVAAIVAVDLLTVVLAGPAARGGRLGVSGLGKVRTAVLMVGIIALVTTTTLIGDTATGPAIIAAGNVVLLVGTVLHAGAGVDYIRRARRAAPRRTLREPASDDDVAA